MAKQKQKKKWINITVTEEQYNKIKQLADDDKRRVGPFAKIKLFDALGVEL